MIRKKILFYKKVFINFNFHLIIITFINIYYIYIYVYFGIDSTIL